MAFFSEVKARLGLDISPFEKGMAKAQMSAKQASTEMGKNMAGVKGLIGFAAIAAGFNAALGRAKELRDTAAETGAALDPAVQRAADLADNLEKGKSALADFAINIVGALQRGVDYAVAFGSQMMGLVDGVEEGIKAIDEGRAKEAKAAQDAKKNAEAQKKAGEEKKKRDAEEVAESKKAATLFAQAEKIKEESRKKQLTLGEKIKETEAAILRAEREKADQSKPAMARLQAGVELEQARANLIELQGERQKAVDEELSAFFGEIDKAADAANDKAAEQAKKDKDRTDELKDQAKTLKEQKSTIEQTLAAQEKGKRASLQDITSGKRNAGGRTRANATALGRTIEEEQRRIDAVSQSEDAVASMPEGAAKEAAKAEGRKRRSALAETQARRKTLEGSLEGKVSDSFGSKQVDELMKVNKELAAVNKALAPTSIKSNK